MNAVLIQKVTNGYIMAPFNGQMIDFAKIVILPTVGGTDVEAALLVADMRKMMEPAQEQPK
jgi:hypothetical protein